MLLTDWKLPIMRGVQIHLGNELRGLFCSQSYLPHGDQCHGQWAGYVSGYYLTGGCAAQPEHKNQHFKLKTPAIIIILMKEWEKICQCQTELSLYYRVPIHIKSISAKFRCLGTHLGAYIRERERDISRGVWFLEQLQWYTTVIR